MKKRLLAMVMTVCMLLSLLPAAQADSSDQVMVTNYEELMAALADSSIGQITIVGDRIREYDPATDSYSYREFTWPAGTTPLTLDLKTAGTSTDIRIQGKWTIPSHVTVNAYQGVALQYESPTIHVNGTWNIADVNGTVMGFPTTFYGMVVNGKLTASTQSYIPMAPVNSNCPLTVNGVMEVPSQACVKKLTLGDGAVVKGKTAGSSIVLGIDEGGSLSCPSGSAVVEGTVQACQMHGAVNFTLSGNLLIDEIMLVDSVLTVPAGSKVTAKKLNAYTYAGATAMKLDGKLVLDNDGYYFHGFDAGSIVIGSAGELILTSGNKLDYEGSTATVTGSGMIRLYALYDEATDSYGNFPNIAYVFGKIGNNSNNWPSQVADTVTIWRNWNSGCDTHSWGLTMQGISTCAVCGTEGIPSASGGGGGDEGGEGGGDDADTVPAVTGVSVMQFDNMNGAFLAWEWQEGAAVSDIWYLQCDLSRDDGETWETFMTMSPGAGELLLSNLVSTQTADFSGTFNKIRFTSVAMPGGQNGVYTQDFDLTIAYEKDAAEPASAAYVQDASTGKYTVTVSGLTAGKEMSVYTYSGAGFTNDQVWAPLTTDRAEGTTVVFENRSIDPEKLATAKYLVVEYDTTVTSSTSVSITATDKSGWKDCVPSGGEEGAHKLTAPIDPEWGVNYCSDGTTFAYPGMIGWTVTDTGYDHNYEVKIYSADGTERCWFPECPYKAGANARQNEWNFSADVLEWLSSGSYYFTVQAKGDGETTLDSDIITSDQWTYTVPDRQLDTPTGLRWSGSKAMWNDATEEEAAGYSVTVYYSETATNDMDSMQPAYGYVTYFGEGDTEAAFDVKRVYGWYGEGYYYFTVKTLSGDVNEVMHSPVSALSGAHHYTGETTHKLKAPADLEWGKRYTDGETGEYFEYPGMISWKTADPAYAQKLQISAYKEGVEEPVFTSGWRHNAGSSDVYRTDWDFSLSILDDYGSGTYYFTVQAVSKDESAADSDIATSDPWTYVEPAAKLNQPTGLRWEGSKAVWDVSADSRVGGYNIEILYSADNGTITDLDSEELETVTRFVWYFDDGITNNWFANWDEEETPEEGYYYFSVKAVSDDLTVARHSDWTPLCVTYLGGEGGGSDTHKLAAPIDLEWGKYYTEQETGAYFTYPGAISWKTADPDYAQTIWVSVYKEGEAERVFYNAWEHRAGEGNVYRTDWDFSLTDLETYGSGTYYFTLQATSDDGTAEDSDIVTSEKWTYVKPTAKLSYPVGLRWEEDNRATWDASADSRVGGYTVDIMYSPDNGSITDMRSEELERVTRRVWFFGEGMDQPYYGLTDPGEAVEEGYYYFRVQSVSGNLNTACHSDWSPVCVAYLGAGPDAGRICHHFCTACGKCTDAECPARPKCSCGEESKTLGSVELTENEQIVIDTSELQVEAGTTLSVKAVEVILPSAEDVPVDQTDVNTYETFILDHAEGMVVETVYEIALVDQDGKEHELQEGETAAVKLFVGAENARAIDEGTMYLMHIMDDVKVLYGEGHKSITTEISGGEYTGFVSFETEGFSPFVLVSESEEPLRITADGKVTSGSCTVAVRANRAFGCNLYIAVYDAAGRVLTTTVAGSSNLAANPKYTLTFDGVAASVKVFMLEAGSFVPKHSAAVDENLNG